MVGIKKSFILAFCHGFNLSYLGEQGPPGAVPVALDRAARTTKEESLLFIRSGLALPGVKMTIDRLGR